MARTPLASIQFPGLPDTYIIPDGLSEDVKQALLQLARKVAYIDDQGQIYYNALYNALYPPADLSSISAVYTQSGAVYDTDTLDSLKTDLVVTAYYSDSSTQIVPATDYTLSGNLTVGTSVITASYDGKTATFNVTVTQEATLSSISAVFNQGSAVIYDTDSLDTLKQYLVVTATYSDSSTATVTDYTLSGTLAEGTSTITVTYAGLTDTFDVTVTAPGVTNPYLTDNMTLWLDGIYNTSNGHNASATVWEDIVGGIEFTNSGITVGSDGMIFDGTAGNAFIGTTPSIPKTVEIVLNPTSVSTTQAVINGFGNSDAGNISIKSSNILEKRGNYQSLGANVQVATAGETHTYTFVDGVGQYVDGVSASATSTNASWTGTGNMVIGGACKVGGGIQTGSAAYPFTGTIYCIRFYSDELTAEEIASNAAVDTTRFNIS